MSAPGPILVLSGPFAPVLSPAFESVVLAVLVFTIFLARRRLATRQGVASAVLVVWLSAGAAAVLDRGLPAPAAEPMVELHRPAQEQAREPENPKRGAGAREEAPRRTG